ncbi:MAG TPA: MFS transporter [Candidatus Microsaccharimonas sp.]|nr:MFS transporter [Candidatus Microsaccharimonas sp.]
MSKQQRLVLIVAIMASFVGALDGFIVNVALPAISRDLGGGITVQQWVVDAYLLTLGSCILIAGSLSDLFGRRRVLELGLIGFGAASLLCAVAPNGTVLIGARVIQGVAGALLTPSSLAMIISAFSGKEQGKAIGAWTAWFSVAAVAGPLLGGIIVNYSSWRWIFAINILPIAICLWLLAQLEQPVRTDARAKVDALGALLCMFGLAGAVYALIEQPKYGWGSAHILVPLIGGLVLLAAFLYQESHTAKPMLPLSLFSRHNFSVGNVATAAIYAGLSLSSFMIVITLQQVGHWSALEAGLSMLPVTVVMFLFSSQAGALAGKYGPQVFMAAGPMVAALGFLLMLRVQPHVNYATELFPGVLLFAIGLALTVAPLTAAILGDVDPKYAGVGSAVNNAVARVAGLIAIAFVGLITGAHIDIHGFHRAMITVAALLLLGGIISAIGIRNPKESA